MIMVVWTAENSSLPITCLTLVDGAYRSIPSDMRVGPSAEFLLEEGGLSNALRYYTDHRIEFSRDSREQYTSDALAYIAELGFRELLITKH